MMSHVIQDSDDDLEGSPSPVKAMEVEGDKATTSSELLRGIHAAQDALAAEGTFPMMDGAFDQVDPTSSKRKRTIRTYGSSAKRSRTTVYGDDMHISPVRNATEGSRSAHVGDWLPATLQDQFAEHNPVEMFPDPSSTVPDNTISQQRMIQQALEPDVPIADVATQNKGDHTQKSESSIPWSAYTDKSKKMIESPMPQTGREATPTVQSQPRSSQSRRSQTVTAGKRSSQTPLRGSHDMADLNQAIESPTAQASSAKSRRSRTAVPQKNLEELPNPVTFLSEIQLEAEVATSRTTETTETARANVAKRRKTSTSPKKPEPTSDELWIGLPQEQYKPRASRSRSAKVTDDEYLQAVHDTLKPKSKRRKTTQDSSQQNGQPLPVPLLIEQTARSSPSVEVVQPKQTPELDAAPLECYNDNKENVAPGTMSPPGSAKAARPPSRPVLVEVAIPAAPVETVRHDEPTPESPKLLFKPQSDQKSTGDAPVSASPPKGKRKKAKARRSQTAATPGLLQRRRVFDSDDSDEDVSPVKTFQKDQLELPSSPAAKPLSSEMPPPPMPAPTEKKKGRGRPRKSDQTKSDEAAATMSAESLGDELEARHDVPLGETDVLPQEEAVDLPVQGGTNHDNDHGSSHDMSASKSTSTKEHKAPGSTPERLPQPTSAALKTPEGKTNSKNATAHSPISKSKVPLRVGLSRRMRIAPLLKIVKK